MSDNTEYPASYFGGLKSLVLASPSGLVVFLVGVILAFWSNAQFDDLLLRTPTGALHDVLFAIRFGTLGIWVVVALLGRQIMVSARDREEVRAAFRAQAESLDRIVAGESSKTQEIAKKSRSFWDRLRNEPKL